jgi:transposase InsO family protein
VVAAARFAKVPTTADVVEVLERAIECAGCAPRHIVSDQGAQFGNDYRQWCESTGTAPRFGAVGQHGSIAVIERFIRTFKFEALGGRSPWQAAEMARLIAAYVTWYNTERPHETLDGATPAEVRDVRIPAKDGHGFEPRPRWPLSASGTRGPPRQRVGSLALAVDCVDGCDHLPIVRLRAA